jgi:hypothetical protein
MTKRLALFHTDTNSQSKFCLISIRTEARVDELFDKSFPGDTLHSLEEVPATAAELFALVRAQRKAGKCVRL